MKKIVTIFIALFCILNLQAQITYYSPDVPKAIPDNDPAGITSTINILETNGISDLNIYVDVSHTFIGDIIISIESPTGTIVTIYDRPGRINTGLGYCAENFTIWLDDQATFPIEDQNIYNLVGTYTPNNPLSAFNGENIQGIWTLTISDNFGFDTGTLNSWGIEANATPAVPSSPWVAISIFLLIGLFVTIRFIFK